MYYILPILLFPFFIIGAVMGIAYAGLAAGFRATGALMMTMENSKKKGAGDGEN